MDKFTIGGVTLLPLQVIGLLRDPRFSLESLDDKQLYQLIRWIKFSESSHHPKKGRMLRKMLRKLEDEFDQRILWSLYLESRDP